MHALSTFHRSRLPHVTPVGATFFVTFRIKDALPLKLMQSLSFQYARAVEKKMRTAASAGDRKVMISKARYQYFKQYDKHLDAGRSDR